MKTNLEEVEEKVPKNDLVCDREVGNCRCSELEERSKKAEARCIELELEVRKRKSEYEALETKFRILEVAKLALEEEIKVLKSRNNEVDDLIRRSDNEEVVGFRGKEVMEGVVDLTEENDEEDKVFQLMTENRVLQCEKGKAENEAEVWKQKFKELESLTLQLQKSLVLKSAEQPFDRKTSDANCCIAACGNKEAAKSKDGSQVGTTLNNTPAVDKAVSFMDSGFSLVSPDKGTGNLQPAGNNVSFLPILCFIFSLPSHASIRRPKHIQSSTNRMDHSPVYIY